jgi:hypothetical protein
MKKSAEYSERISMGAVPSSNFASMAVALKHKHGDFFDSSLAFGVGHNRECTIET